MNNKIASRRGDTNNGLNFPLSQNGAAGTEGNGG